MRSGISGQAGDTQGNPFPQLAIGEYKVITSNYKAEYDQISSAAITAITRSGTNQFEGEAFGTYTADNWRARTPAELDSGTKTPSESKEFGLSFGGPIIEDRLHFFFTYEGKRYETPVTVTARSPAASRRRGTTCPPSALAQLGPATIAFDEDLFFAKLDWEPTRRRSLRPVGEIPPRGQPGRPGRHRHRGLGRHRHHQRRRPLRVVVEAQWQRLAQRSAAHLRECALPAAPAALRT